QKCRRPSDNKACPPAIAAEQQVKESGEKESRGPGRLQESGRLGPFLLWPCLRDDGCTGCPFAADPQGGQEPIQCQVPPVLGQGGQSSKQGIDQDCGNESLRTAEVVSHHPEGNAADCPADQENGKDDATVPANHFLGACIAP